MTQRTTHFTLLTLLLICSMGLFTWWISQLQPLKMLSWASIPPEIADLPVIAPRKHNPDLRSQALERPLFWESRRPLALKTEPGAAVTIPLELLGVVSESNQRVALLRPLQGTPPLRVRRLRAGESYNGATLQDIGADQVTLKSANGIEILRIKRGSQNPAFAQQPAKLSAPATVEVTRGKLPPSLQNRIDELKGKTAPQAQPPAPPPQ